MKVKCLASDDLASSARYCQNEAVVRFGNLDLGLHAHRESIDCYLAIGRHADRS
jgi:hypothetical protein